MSRTRTRMASVALLLGCTVVLGCGDGKKKASGPSLDAQYRKVMAEADLAARASRLLAVAGKQHKAGDLLGMEQSLNSAADAAKNLDDAKAKALTLNRVAEAFGRAGRTVESKNLLREVSKAADQIGEAEIKITVLTRMAYTYGKHLNSLDIATSYLKNCEGIAAGIPRPEGRIDALLEVAVTYHELALADEAQGLFAQALEAARALDDGRKRADSVANAAAARSKMNQADEAQTTFQEAEKLAGEIPDAMSRAYALIHLSDRLKASSRRADAQRILKLAEAAADKVADASMRTPLLETIDRSRR